jgi:hypothetical protein
VNQAAKKTKRNNGDAIPSVHKVLARYFLDAKNMAERDKWAAQWAREAADETEVPKTREDYERLLRVAYHAGVFFGIDECSSFLPG